jgi:hypothetical protein
LPTVTSAGMSSTCARPAIRRSIRIAWPSLRAIGSSSPARATRQRAGVRGRSGHRPGWDEAIWIACRHSLTGEARHSRRAGHADRADGANPARATRPRGQRRRRCRDRPGGHRAARHGRGIRTARAGHRAAPDAGSGPLRAAAGRRLRAAAGPRPRGAANRRPRAAAGPRAGNTPGGPRAGNPAAGRCLADPGADPRPGDPVAGRAAGGPAGPRRLGAQGRRAGRDRPPSGRGHLAGRAGRPGRGARGRRARRGDGAPTGVRHAHAGRLPRLPGPGDRDGTARLRGPARDRARRLGRADHRRAADAAGRRRPAAA